MAGTAAEGHILNTTHATTTATPKRAASIIFIATLRDQLWDFHITWFGLFCAQHVTGLQTVGPVVEREGLDLLSVLNATCGRVRLNVECTAGS